jgi:hypothetical protein
MTAEERTKAILELAKFTGVEVTADFLKNTAEHFPQAGIPRIHSLFEGIYKPAGDPYAFSIFSQSAIVKDRGIYPDEIKIQDDGSWTLLYSAKNVPLEKEPNKSLFACLQDKILVLVVAKAGPQGGDSARYRLLGPALIESFDPGSRRFTMRGASAPVSDHIRQYGGLESAALMDIRNRLIFPFQLRQIRESLTANRDVREKAFRRIMLDEYRGQCAVCQAKSLLREEGQPDLLEAAAAHIVSVQASGPDDPRNGLSLCPRHHWAFDEGLFTVTDAVTVKVSPAVLRAERRRFDLEEYDGETLVAPAHEICRPHEEAIDWHRKRVFRAA